MEQLLRATLFALGLVAVGALSARAVPPTRQKLSGGRRRAVRQDEREARLRAAEAYEAAAQASIAAEPMAPAREKARAKADVHYAAPWVHPLKKALSHGGSQRSKRDRSEARRKQVQLATVDPATGRPSVRTIVFRGFLPVDLSDMNGRETCLPMFVTDSRAEKVRHLAAGRGPVEVCWWLDEAGVQFRISGDAVLASADSTDPALRAACEAVWERLGDSTRRTFMWAQPGERVAVVSEQAAAAAAAAAAAGGGGGRVALADANFCLLVVLPHRVDELRLGGSQKRHRYTLFGGTGDAGPLALPPGSQWRVESVNP